MTKSESSLCNLIAAARNGSETLSVDGLERHREFDSKALSDACLPFLEAARNETPHTEISLRILEIFGEA